MLNTGFYSNVTVSLTCDVNLKQVFDCIVQKPSDVLERARRFCPVTEEQFRYVESNPKDDALYEVHCIRNTVTQHSNGFPIDVKVNSIGLTEVLIGDCIQEEAIEDARATMKLYLWYRKNLDETVLSPATAHS